MDVVVSIMSQKVKGTTSVDRQLLKEGCQELDDQPPKLAYIMIGAHTPKGTSTYHASQFNVCIINQESHCIEASHAVCLYETGQVLIYLAHHRYDLVMVFLNLVVSISIS